jgi:diguanylate cyclase (GGDEF)-like protein
VVLLSDTGEKDALRLAERIRQTVEKHGFRCPLGELNLTVSIGVASARKGVETDGGELFAQADRALYQAKAAGRNCVRV